VRGEERVREAATAGWRRLLVGGLVAIAAVHTVAAIAGLDVGVNVVVALANLMALARAVEIAALGQERRLLIFAAGYAALFALLVGLAQSPLLFVVFAFLYVGCFDAPMLLGLVIILLICIVVLTPYWLQLAVLLSLPYLIVYRLWQRATDKFALAALLVGFVLIVLVVLPIFSVVFKSTPQTLLDTVHSRDFQAALANTFWTATVTTIVVLLFGVPLAYAMARLEFRGKDVIDSLIDLPILVPQSVAGIALMVLFGPKTPLGQFLESHFGVSVSGSYLGIIACQVFVSSPFLIRAAMTSFLQMDERLENVSRTLGASAISTFFRVSLPLAAPGIFAGCILTWARAVSETGSIMIIAYRPLTVGTLSFDVFTQYGLEEATPVAVMLVLICLWAFIALRWMRAYMATMSARRLQRQVRGLAAAGQMAARAGTAGGSE